MNNYTRSTDNRLFRIWHDMIHRCSNANWINYNDYGGRGITVRWPDFRSFVDWALTNGYQDSLMIDRVENSGHYEPGNCRWVTRKISNANRRFTVWVEAFGERKPRAAWIGDSRCAVKLWTLRNRLKNGWHPEVAISTPAR